MIHTITHTKRSFQRSIILLLLAPLVLISCGDKNSDAEMRAKEQAEIDDKMNGITVSVYKSVKLGVRAIPVPNTPPPGDVDMDKINDLSRIAKKLMIEMQDTSAELSMMETLALAKDLKDLKDFVNETDEDKFPTILEVADGMAGSDLAARLNWSNAKEHLTLYAIMEAAYMLPKEFSVYEIVKTNPDDLPDNEIKLLTYVVQSIAYLRMDSPYLAEYNCTKGMSLLENNKIQFTQTEGLDFELFENSKLKGQEKMSTEYHAILSLMRSFTRFYMNDEEKKELAYDDLEVFMKDSEKLGVENELTWTAGSVLYIKREDKEKALYNLNKLKASPLLGDSERNEINKTIEYLENRNPDKALVAVTDNIFMVKIVGSYTAAQFRKTKMYDDLKSSESGQMLTQWPERIGKQYDKLKKYTGDGIESVKDFL